MHGTIVPMHSAPHSPTEPEAGVTGGRASGGSHERPRDALAPPAGAAERTADQARDGAGHHAERRRLLVESVLAGGPGENAGGACNLRLRP